MMSSRASARDLVCATGGWLRGTQRRSLAVARDDIIRGAGAYLSPETVRHVSLRISALPAVSIRPEAIRKNSEPPTWCRRQPRGGTDAESDRVEQRDARWRHAGPRRCR